MQRGRLAALAVSSVMGLGLVLVGGATSPVGAATRSIPRNFDASQMPGNEAEDAIAINPTNPRDIVAMSTLPDITAGLAVDTTFDGGTTWSRQVIGTGGGDLGDICCDEQLAWDRFGNLWMVYLHNVNPDTVVALSTDGGLTFTKVASVAPTTPKGSTSPNNAEPKSLVRGGNHFADQPSISAGTNSVWVSYTSFPSTVIQAFGWSISGPGQFGAISPLENVPTSDGRGDYGDTAVGPDGQVMVIYQDATSGQGGSHIYTAVDPDGFGPHGFGDPRLLARSRVGGFDYIPAQPDRSVDAEANLAWDRSGGPHTGRVYAIWTQEVKNESDNMDVMLQASDDDGATWTAPVRLNRDRTVNSQFNPAIALDQTSGAVAVSWYDCRKDLGTGGPGDTDGIPNDDFQIWATDSTNGGQTFAANFRVSAGTSNAPDAGSFFDTGDYTHAAFVHGRFYPAWSDNSNSTGTNPDGTLHQLDLFTAAVPVS
jgi:hypothetical protein